MMICRRSTKGFTLIELILVITILGLLATIVAINVMPRGVQAKQSAALVQISNFKNGLQLFRLDNGFYPSTEQGLEALVVKPTTGRTPNKWPEGGYLESRTIPKDPWGGDYVYISPGIGDGPFDIISYGADGVEGGEGEDADITSWQVEQ